MTRFLRQPFCSRDTGCNSVRQSPSERPAPSGVFQSRLCGVPRPFPLLLYVGPSWLLPRMCVGTTRSLSRTRLDTGLLLLDYFRFLLPFLFLTAPPSQTKDAPSVLPIVFSKKVLAVPVYVGLVVEERSNIPSSSLSSISLRISLNASHTKDAPSGTGRREAKLAFSLPEKFPPEMRCG